MRAMAAAPAAPAVRELTPAESSKDEGNAAFRRGDWAAAVEHYSRYTAACILALPIGPLSLHSCQAPYVCRMPNRAGKAGKAHRPHLSRAAVASSLRRALELDPGLGTALNNRALCHIKLRQHAEAEADCSAVLARDAGNVKAFMRRATAR